MGASPDSNAGARAAGAEGLRRILLPTFLAAAIIIVLAGCSAGSRTGSNTSGPGPGRGSDLDVGFIAEPASLDFTKNDGAAIPQALLVNVYEGLVKLDGDGRIVPLLARR
ncbi:MAG: hypothetical protein ACRDP8_26650, partial [Actinopolymorphaceae bacterium]